MNSAHARRVYAFQEVKRVPLAAILEHYGVLSDLKRIGAQHFGCCPIHDGTNKKQFVCDLDKQLWKCFGDCQKGGGTLEFVSAMEGVDIGEAAQRIGQWFAIASSRHQAGTQSKQRRKVMSGERPSHKCFVVEDRGEGDDKDAFWTRIGSAWPHKDGKGLNLQLAALPANGGRIVLREYTDKDAEEDEKKNVKRKK